MHKQEKQGLDRQQMEDEEQSNPYIFHHYEDILKEKDKSKSNHFLAQISSECWQLKNGFFQQPLSGESKCVAMN